MLQDTPHPALRAAQSVFIGLIPDRVGLIETRLNQASAHRPTGPLLMEIAEILHQLAGTAETLGLAEIGGLSRRIETRIRRSGGADADAHEVFTEIRPQTEGLLDALEAIYLS